MKGGRKGDEGEVLRKVVEVGKEAEKDGEEEK